MSCKLELDVVFPECLDVEKFLKVWKRATLHKKIDLLNVLYRTNMSGDVVCVDVQGYLFVSRSKCNIQPSKKSDTTLFEITTLSDDGTPFCCKNSIIGLFNHDKSLALAIAKSFPNGTFLWDAARFEGEKYNDAGYVVFD